VFIIPSKSSLKNLLTDKGIKHYALPMVEIRRSITSLLFYFPILFINAFRLTSIINKERIDIIQVNDFYNLLGVTSKKLGFKGKLFTYVRFLPAVMPRPLRNTWVRLAQNNSDKVIAVSDAVLKQLPAKPNTIRIYDPVKLEEKLPDKNYDKSSLVNILYLANYINGKGQDEAIRIFKALYANNKNLRMKFVGGDMGLQQNRNYLATLEEIVKRNQLNDVINFTDFNADVEKEIKNADIVLNLSKAESFSMTCLEAAFYGTALAASRCGGPEEIISDRQTGILITTDNTKDLLALERLTKDADLRQTYAKAGKEYVREKFSIDKFKQQFGQILND
jgi:glycosyltransferase involved in cell wall biosynthesis